MGSIFIQAAWDWYDFSGLRGRSSRGRVLIELLDDWLMVAAMTVNTGWFYTLIMCKCLGAFTVDFSRQARGY
jgi:hypothetical protein